MGSKIFAFLRTKSFLCEHIYLYEKSVHDDLTHTPGQNGRHFADDIFICIFVYEKFYILIKISLKFVPKGPNDNNPALV